MEMIDVLKKLEEIAQTRPELVADAVDNVSRTNPVQVQDNVGGMSDVHIGAQEVVGEYADEDGNLKMPKQDVLRAMAAEKEKASFPRSYEIETAMGMVNDKFGNDGIAKDDMDMSSEQPSQEPEALEGNAFAQAVTQAKAAGMKKGDKFKVGDEEHTLRDSDFEGESTRDMTTEKTEDQVNELDLKDLKPKASDVITYGKGGSLKYIQIEYEILGTLENMLINNSEQEVLKRIADFVTDEVGEEHVGKAMEIIQKAKENKDEEMTFDDMIEQLKGKKETVKESIQISTDSPQEASMMMQILKLAGVQQVDSAMINQEPEHGSDMDPGALNKQMDVPGDDAMGSMQMAKMRDMMTAPEEEKAEETFANSMGDEKEEPKYQDTDTLVNFHSGGMNRQKKTYPKVASGDNPMATEDTVTAESLANSLREQYETFKETYIKVAETKAKPDFLDMDKDGNKKEPMKKAIKDKEAK